MFLYQVLLFAGGLATTVFSISAIVPIPRDNPFSGF